MSPTPRMRKVNSILREVLADEIERLSDPRVEIISVTAVDTSPDLRKAKVYVSTLDLGQGPEAIEALTRAAARLQGAVARQVRMKYTPQLEFAIDSGVVQGDRIDAILREIAVAPDSEGEEK